MLLPAFVDATAPEVASHVHYHVLAGIGERNLATEVLGHRLAMPILAAPTAFQRLAHSDGEVALPGVADAINGRVEC